ncbi:MAG: hypothetical protein H7244_00380, partial [Herminiimonas sp.]|nr:hypothetical protein [Herminiimonas sp.]
MPTPATLPPVATQLPPKSIEIEVHGYKADGTFDETTQKAIDAAMKGGMTAYMVDIKPNTPSPSPGSPPSDSTPSGSPANGPTTASTTPTTPTTPTATPGQQASIDFLNGNTDASKAFKQKVIDKSGAVGQDTRHQYLTKIASGNPVDGETYSQEEIDAAKMLTAEKPSQF